MTSFEQDLDDSDLAASDAIAASERLITCVGLLRRFAYEKAWLKFNELHPSRSLAEIHQTIPARNAPRIYGGLSREIIVEIPSGDA